MRTEALEIRLSKVRENVSAVSKPDYDGVGVGIEEHHFSRPAGVNCILFLEEMLLPGVPSRGSLCQVPVSVHKLLANSLRKIVVPIPPYTFGA